jgi:hypothetical protein
MNRLRAALVILVLIMLIPLGIAAQEDEPYIQDDGEPTLPSMRLGGSSGSSWRDESLARQLSIGAGVWRAYWGKVTYEGGNEQAYLFDASYLFSIGTKYFFYGQYFGIGLDGILMESHTEPYEGYYAGGTYHDGGKTTVTQWLFDLNAYGRYPLFYFMNIVGGVGLTCNYVDMGDMPDSKDKFSLAGWNAKLGVEFFVTYEFSISLFATYHSFKRGATVAGMVNQNANVKLTSFFLMANYYL